MPNVHVRKKRAQAIVETIIVVAFLTAKLEASLKASASAERSWGRSEMAQLRAAKGAARQGKVYEHLREAHQAFLVGQKPGGIGETIIVMDGVYAKPPDGRMLFHPLPATRNENVAHLVLGVC
jgi:hypothetical protein